MAALVGVLLAAPAFAAEEAVSRGAYLAAAAGCDRCHTDAEHGGAPYAGGRRLATPYGTLATPNITPDPETGIGRWSSADFECALRWGIAPDATHFLPVFPFPFYNRLTEGDLSDLKAFLDSVPAVSWPRPAGADRLALWSRMRAGIAVAATPFPGPFQPDPQHDAVRNRGAYLVATVGRCGECHTPRTLWGAPAPDQFLAGHAAGRDGGKVPNITPDPKTGIGDWSGEDIAELLSEGRTPDFDFVGGAMVEIVKNTARLSAEDRRAIAVFLRTVPAKPFGGARQSKNPRFGTGRSLATPYDGGRPDDRG